MSAEKQPLSFPIEELYHDDGYKLIILSCILSILCISVVVARFFAVRLKKANLWWDDWLCIPALVCFPLLKPRTYCFQRYSDLSVKIMALGLNAINITLVKKAGVGRHVASFGPEAPLKVMMWAKVRRNSLSPLSLLPVAYGSATLMLTMVFAHRSYTQSY